MLPLWGIADCRLLFDSTGPRGSGLVSVGEAVASVPA
jgi:hypothetical protein